MLPARIVNNKCVLVSLISFWLLCCSSDAESKFEEVITRLDKYFVLEPIFLTSNKIEKENNETYAYYALKIINYAISYDIVKKFSKSIPYNAFVKIECKFIENSKSGDVRLEINNLELKQLSSSGKPMGFSTTSMALENSNFSSESEELIIIVTYRYQTSNWVYNNLFVGSKLEYFLEDLKIFDQNKDFRDVIGMASEEYE